MEDKFNIEKYNGYGYKGNFKKLHQLNKELAQKFDGNPEMTQEKINYINNNPGFKLEEQKTETGLRLLIKENKDVIIN